jgi:hypothetical protein
VSALVSSGVHHQTFHYRRGGGKTGVPFQFGRGRSWQTVYFHATRGQHGTALGEAAMQLENGGNGCPGRRKEEDNPRLARLGSRVMWANRSSGPTRVRKQEQIRLSREIEPKVVWADAVRKRIRLLWKNVNEVGCRNHLAQVKEGKVLKF